MELGPPIVNEVQDVKEDTLKMLLLENTLSVTNTITKTFSLSVKGFYGQGEFRSLFNNFGSKTMKKVKNLRVNIEVFSPDLWFKPLNDRKIPGGPNIEGRTTCICLMAIGVLAAKTNKKVVLEFNSKEDDPKKLIDIDNCTILATKLFTSQTDTHTDRAIFHSTSDIFLGSDEELIYFQWSSNNPHDWNKPYEEQLTVPHTIVLTSYVAI